jgi:hypothetical protein
LQWNALRHDRLPRGVTAAVAVVCDVMEKRLDGSLQNAGPQRYTPAFIAQVRLDSGLTMRRAHIFMENLYRKIH